MRGDVVRHSAGILLYRLRAEGVEVLIAHPGGPLWARRDLGAWSIPKGLLEVGEEAFAAAVREFREETGFELPDSSPLELGDVTLASGKQVTAWAMEGDVDPALLAGNLVEMTWPRGSGRHISFPEIDVVAWVTPDVAVEKLNPAQGEFVRRLTRRLGLEIAP